MQYMRMQEGDGSGGLVDGNWHSMGSYQRADETRSTDCSRREEKEEEEEESEAAAAVSLRKLLQLLWFGAFCRNGYSVFVCGSILCPFS